MGFDVLFDIKKVKKSINGCVFLNASEVTATLSVVDMLMKSFFPASEPPLGSE